MYFSKYITKKFYRPIMKVSKKSIIGIIKFTLMVICVYSVTRFAENPLQRQYKHAYYDYYYLYFTYQTVYMSIFTYVLGLICNSKSFFSNKKPFLQTHQMILPNILALEALKTILFWVCFFCDKRLIIYKKYIDNPYKTPILTELGQHLFSFVLVSLEAMTCTIRKSLSQLIFLISYLLFYFFMTIIYKEILGSYLYPLLKQLQNDFNVFLFFASLGLITFFASNQYLNYKTRFEKKIEMDSDKITLIHS